MRSKQKRSKLLMLLLLALALAAYPGFVLGYTWSQVFNSTLPGGENGPLDAYRHTLASAVVAYTLDEKAVRLVNDYMERSGKRSNAMDIHNNLIGAAIGMRATRFADIEPAVAAAIANGTVNASRPGQITWLEPGTWQQGKLR